MALVGGRPHSAYLEGYDILRRSWFLPLPLPGSTGILDADFCEARVIAIVWDQGTAADGGAVAASEGGRLRV